MANAADRLRSWDWPVPDELIIFGDNGQGDHFGVWAPREGGARPIVVQIGEVFEDACMAVVGDDVASFLMGWGSYYTLLLGDDGAVRKIAPDLPEDRPDPYERGLTAGQVDGVARSAAR